MELGIDGIAEFQVSLQRGNSTEGFCSGVLLTSYIVLTAAHCFKTANKPRIGERTHWTDVNVVAGKEAPEAERQRQTSKLKGRPRIHEEYQEATGNNDIALLQLSSPIIPSKYVKYALLPDENVGKQLSDKAEVGRWTLNSIEKTWQKASVTKYPTSKKCVDKWGSKFLEGMMCAGVAKQKRCESRILRDSSGPLICSHKTRGEKKFVCGIITSFGQGALSFQETCGNEVEESPTIYTDVSKYHRWIMLNSCDFRLQNCPANTVQCCNHFCLPSEARTDGFNDCGDNSDESIGNEILKKCPSNEICPKPSTIFTALSPKFIYPFSTYTIKIFLESGTPTKKYAFQAWTTSEDFQFDKSALTELRPSESGQLSVEVKDLRTEIYGLILKVTDTERNEDFYYHSSIASGKNIRVLVHTDKYIYSPQETVHFHINFFQFPSDFKIASGNVRVWDAKNIAIFLQTVDITSKKSVDGEIHLSDSFNPGTWKISVDTRFDMKSGELRQYNNFVDFTAQLLPSKTFSVSVDVPDHIWYTSEGIKTMLRLSVRALYNDGAGVIGTCKFEILLIAREICSQSITKQDHIDTSIEDKPIDLKDFLNNDYVANGAALLVKVTVTDSWTGLSSTKQSTVTISRYQYKIQPFAMNNYRHSKLPFFISFRTVNLLNQPFLAGNDIISLSNTGRRFNNPTILSQTKNAINLKFETWGPQAPYFQVKFKGLTYEYDLPKIHSNATDYLQIRLLDPISEFNEVSGLEAQLKVHVMTTSPVNHVNSAIFCDNKIISSSTIKNTPSKDDFNISVSYTVKSCSSAKLVIFTYINQVFVSDSLNLRMASMQEPILSKTLEPGESWKLDFDAPVGASVFLYGAEESSFEGRETFLTKHWSEREFESSNRGCANDITRGFFQLKRAGMTVMTNAPTQSSIVGENDCRTDDASRCSLNSEEERVSKGDSWFTKSFKSSSDPTNFEVTMPQKNTSWIIRGYSIRDQDVIPNFFRTTKLRNSKEFSLSLNLPFSVVVGEQLEVPFYIHNNWPDSKYPDVPNVNITLKKSNKFEFPEDRVPECMQRLIPCDPGSVQQNSFTIELLKAGTVTIELEAKVDSSSEKTSVKKTLIVKPYGEIRSYASSSFFIALPEPVDPAYLEPFIIGMGNPPELPFLSGSASKNSNNKIKGSKILASPSLFVSSDILSLMASHLDRLVTLPEVSVESKVLRFAANTAILTYLDATRQDEAPHRERAKISLEKGYQFLLSIRCTDGSFTDTPREYSDGSFNDALQQNQCTGSTQITARIVRYLLIAKSYIFVDDEVLKQGLAFLKTRQDSDGGFRQNQNDVIPSATPPKSARVALTALALLTFLEGQRSGGLFSDYEYLSTVAKARKFFQNYYKSALKGESEIDDAHAQALMAYAEHAWHELNPNAVTDKHKYWSKLPLETLVNQTTWIVTTEMKVETLSYMVLTSCLRNSDFDAIFLLNQIIFLELNQNGGFLSTRDSEVAVMAMAKVAEKEHNKNSSKFQFSASFTRGVDNYTAIADATNVEMNQSLAYKEYRLPRKTKGVKVAAIGTGLVFAQLRQTYVIDRVPHKGLFKIKVRQAKSEGSEFSLNICISHRKDGNSGMAVLDVNLPSGYKFVQFNTTQSVRRMPNYKTHEFVDINSKLRIVLSSVPNSIESSCVVVEALRAFIVDQLSPSYVRAFEFFHTTKVSQYIYEFMKNV